MILNRANEYYENNKEELKEKANNKYKKLSEEEKYMKREYKKLSEEEKYIKREYGRKRYHNMSEEDKQRLEECQRNYLESRRHLL